MNMDFQGLVPTVAVQSALLTSAAFPRLTLTKLEKETRGKEETRLKDTVSKLRKRLQSQEDDLRGKDGELRGKDEMLDDFAQRLQQRDREIERLQKELRCKVKGE